MSWVATALFLVGTAVTVYNNEQTQNRLDDQAVAGIQQQARRQHEADAKVDDAVKELEQSSAQDARREALRSYTAALDANKRSSTVGLPDGVGSDAFKQSAKAANDDVRQYGLKNAGLMSTIEGANTQRMNEGFGYGRLGTDISLIGRQSAGDDFINDLKLKGIQRNPWLDLAAGTATGAAGAMANGSNTSSGLNSTAGGNGSPYKSSSVNKTYGKGP